MRISALLETRLFGGFFAVLLHKSDGAFSRPNFCCNLFCICVIISIRGRDGKREVGGGACLGQRFQCLDLVLWNVFFEDHKKFRQCSHYRLSQHWQKYGVVLADFQDCGKSHETWSSQILSCRGDFRAKRGLRRSYFVVGVVCSGERGWGGGIARQLNHPPPPYPPRLFLLKNKQNLTLFVSIPCYEDFA